MITEAERVRLEWFFETGSAMVEERYEHYIVDERNDDYEELPESYCYDCAKKKVAALCNEQGASDAEFSIRDGSSGESDSIPVCEMCDCLLRTGMTSCCCDGEVDGFIEYGFDPNSQYDCYYMDRVINSGRGWEVWDGWTGKYIIESEQRYFEKLHLLCRRILDECWWITPAVEYRHMWE